MTCGGCGSPRPAGKEQKKSYRAQKRILLSSSPGMYYNNLCLVTFVGWGGTAGGGGDMTCGGCGSPRPAGKEQKKSYRAQKTNSAFVITRYVLQQFVTCHLCGVGVGQLVGEGI